MVGAWASTRCSECGVRGACFAVSAGLSEQDVAQAEYPAGAIVACAGSESETVSFVQSGWACRFEMFPDGRRQIYDIVLPGDLVAYEDLLMPRCSSSTIALSTLRVCVVPREAVGQAIERCGRNRKLAADRCLAYLQRLRSLIAALGRQAALPRFATLVLSLQARLRAVGQADDAGMPFHLRQRDIADVLGLTSVHAGRVLRSLAADGVLRIEADRLLILNSARLLQLSQR